MEEKYKSPSSCHKVSQSYTIGRDPDLYTLTHWPGVLSEAYASVYETPWNGIVSMFS